MSKVFMRAMIVRPVSLMLLMVLLSPPVMAGKRLYKWVDDKGNVYYSDKVPPSAAPRRKVIINEQGLPVKTIERAKTPAEIEAERRRQAELAKQRAIEARKKARDRMLLDTFATVGDIIKARDEKLVSIRNQIRITDSSIVKLENQLARLRSRAADAERAGRPISQQLKANIRSIESQIANNRRYIRKRRIEEQAIRKRFEEYIARFKELKGID